MDLYLIRHAQSLNNARPEELRVEDPPLSDLGREQASRLMQRVAELELTQILVSPFLRTLQTAEFLRQAIGLDPRVWVLLHECGGCVQGPSPSVMVGRPGLTRSAIQAEFPHCEIDAGIDERGWWQSQPYETREQATVRAGKLLDETLRRFAGTTERVAYVMHADIEMLLLECLPSPVPAVPFNTSVTRLSLTPAGARVEEYNDVQHLPQELRTL